tara:strand:- start:19 stop:348 length:330 start_codon:yes stop_codon:yes gene_type:complete
MSLMVDKQFTAMNIERRYRTFSRAWSDILIELRAERGALLGSNEFGEQIAMQKATSLDKVDERIQKAETWLVHYETERKRSNKTLRGYAKKIKEIQDMTDAELEGNYEI